MNNGRVNHAHAAVFAGNTSARQCACLTFLFFHDTLGPAAPSPSPSASASSAYGSEPSAAAVFASLRALVTAQATTHAAWQAFAVAFLDPETEAFITARLPAEGGDGGDDEDSSSSPPSKKRKKAGGAGAAKASSESDGGVPEVTLAVAMLDGTKFSVTVPGRGCVREVKREIAKVQQGSAAAPPAAARCGASITRASSPHLCCSLRSQSQGQPVGLMDIFVHGTEDALPDDGRVDRAPILGAAALFMLQKPGEL